MNKLFLSALLALSVNAWAQSVEVKDPWVRATVSATGTGAFMQLRSAEGGQLLEVRSPVAGVAEVHEMAMVNNVMKMRAVDRLPLPAGQPVDLKPGGFHVMLMDLQAPLKAGETVPLTLVIEGKDGKRFTQDVRATVRPLNATLPQQH